jgi:hypothetical protein
VVVEEEVIVWVLVLQVVVLAVVVLMEILVELDLAPDIQVE